MFSLGILANAMRTFRFDFPVLYTHVSRKSALRGLLFLERHPSQRLWSKETLVKQRFL